MDARQYQNAFGAYDLGSRRAGFKTWVNTPAGASSLATVFDMDDGSLLAAIEAAALGTMRTAAAAGLATGLMAAKDASDFALVGTGRQAFSQLRAVAAVRPLRRVRIFCRDSGRRAQLAEQAAAVVDCEIVESHSVGDALSGASIVTLVTRAHEPFVDVSQIEEGAHVNAMGAVLPANAEIHPAVSHAADQVVVDSLVNARRVSREINDLCGEDEAAWSAIRTLGELIADGAERPPKPRLTLFKSVGMGLSDLAVALVVLDRARDREDRGDAGRPNQGSQRFRGSLSDPSGT